MKNILEYLLIIVTFLIIIILLVKDFLNESNIDNKNNVLVFEEVLCLKRDICKDDEIKDEDVFYQKVPSYLLNEESSEGKIKTKITIEDLKEKYARVNLSKNTILNSNYLYSLDEIIKEENYIMYSNIVVPESVVVNDVVDIRIKINDTQDYIVLNNKKIIDIKDNNVWFNLTNFEQQVLLGAIERIGAGSVVYAEKRGEEIDNAR